MNDFHDITRRVYEYGYGIDTRDWTLYRSIFANEIHMNFQSYNGNPAATMQADDWVAGCRRLFDNLDATQHSMTNPLVEVTGDTARCRMYMQAEHFLQNTSGNSDFALGGYYDDQLIRTVDGWKITAVTLNVFWSRGNRQIMELALKGARKY